MILLQVYIALALAMAFLGLDNPVSRALRQSLSGAVGGLFTRRNLRIAIALAAMIFVASLASRQPALIGLAGLGDVVLYLDVTLLALLAGSIKVVATALDHLARLQPWRLWAPISRSRAPRQRRTARPKRPAPSDADEDGPGYAFALMAA